MAKHLHLNILKANFYYRWLLCGLVICLGGQPICSQGLTYQQSVSVNKPGALSIDRLSNIYLADAKHNLLKFAPTGKLIQTYSPPATGHIASAEAWSTVKTLLFYDDRQQLTLLDRFLTPITAVRLTDFTNGIIRAATLAADDRIWLLNESDMTLSKIDIRYPDAILKTELTQILDQSAGDIRFMREYQNHLYILDAVSGIYVFDNMGNFKKKLLLPGISYLGFKGEELYYVKNNQLIFQHLYTLKTRTLPLPADKNYQASLVGENFYYLFHPAGFDIFSLL